MSYIKCNLKITSNTAYLYVLSEAQFKPEYLMPWRMIKYTVRIIDQHLDTYKTTVLPVVLPLVIYQGDKPYPYPTNVFALCADPELAKAYMFNDMHLLDTSQLTNEQIAEAGLASLLLGVMHHAHLRDLVKIIARLMPHPIDPKTFTTQDAYLQHILLYLLRLAKIEHPAELKALLPHIIEPMRNKLMTVEQVWLNQGMEKGIQQGELEGERKSLLLQLSSKFTQVSKEYIALIKTADEAKLIQWLKKILFANHIDDVFH